MPTTEQTLTREEQSTTGDEVDAPVARSPWDELPTTNDEDNFPASKERAITGLTASARLVPTMKKPARIFPPVRPSR
ncbi:hypothetical protein H4Q26_010287 [Puccinia striiformis f. sp. tritici PST-130]|nr:hypothetical protein H4Q26_010287 [Puccinia striiformis f. sp. tritici PST-130]